MKLQVIIDNGHGIDTPGKCSPDKVIKEWEYNRDIVAAVVDRLKCDSRYNLHILVPEQIDIPLATRVKRINSYCAEYGAKNCMMVSVHLNAATNGQWSKATGWECYTTRGQNNSDKLSKCFYEAADMVLDEGETIRTDYTDGDADKEAGYYILKGANCPAVLTENFFMDGIDDYKYLLSPVGFNKIVNIHVLGINNYYHDYYNPLYK